MDTSNKDILEKQMDKSKAQLRKELEEAYEAFIAAGGEVTVLPEQRKKKFEPSKQGSVFSQGRKSVTLENQ